MSNEEQKRVKREEIRFDFNEQRGTRNRKLVKGEESKHRHCGNVKNYGTISPAS